MPKTYFWSLVASVLVGQYRSLATNDQKYVLSISDGYNVQLYVSHQSQPDFLIIITCIIFMFTWNCLISLFSNSCDNHEINILFTTCIIKDTFTDFAYL